ncbi:MAG: ABC transporter substrate-binding protein, partial [Erysipelotrichaceae bacterium]|nr:ABC transporter substrate-binding protein [Erysipelotrichaceae bacterium]
MNKKLFVTALSSLLAVSALAGCSGGGSSTPTPDAGSSTPAATAEAGGGEASTTPQVLRFGCSGYDIVLNPVLSSNVYDGWANDLMFQGLTKTNSSGEYVEGDITDSIELSEDKLTYTFTLKDNVTFSDGSPMTADDVVFTYMTMKDPDYTGPRAGVAATYDSVEKIDDTHVAFHMVAASPANLQNFTYGVLSKAHYEYSSMEEFEAKNNDPMGTGPFKLESAQAKQYINLVKNENYWDAANAPKLDGVQFLEVSEEALLPALQNKEIDFAQPAAKLENVEAVEEMADTHLVSYLANGYTFMCFNTTRPTLEDVKVRQALVYALDRRNFLLAEYGSNELVALGMCPISKTS